jgi:hypothetical protein
VDEGHVGHGLGAALLLDVITRVASLSDAIGCRGLLVHAVSEAAEREKRLSELMIACFFSNV